QAGIEDDWTTLEGRDAGRTARTWKSGSCDELKRSVAGNRLRTIEEEGVDGAIESVVEAEGSIQGQPIHRESEAVDGEMEVASGGPAVEDAPPDELGFRPVIDDRPANDSAAGRIGIRSRERSKKVAGLERGGKCPAGVVHLAFDDDPRIGLIRLANVAQVVAGESSEQTHLGVIDQDRAGVRPGLIEPVAPVHEEHD